MLKAQVYFHSVLFGNLLQFAVEAMAQKYFADLSNL